MATAKIAKARVLRDNAFSTLRYISDLSVTAATDMVVQSRFRLRCDRLHDLEQEFMHHHTELIFLLTTNELASTADQEIRNDFMDMCDRVQMTYVELFPPVIVQLPRENSIDHTSGLGSNKPNVRLPKIDLPRFSGTPKEWPTFIDLFNSLIHNNTSLQTIDKFQYLHSSLSGEPLQLIRGFSLTVDNYTAAYDRLVAQYDNKRQLATFYWEEMINAKCDGKNTLQQLLNIFHENLCMLDKLEFHLEKNSFADFILAHALISKLDKSTRERFELQVSNPTLPPTFAEVQSFVSNHCKALDTIADSSSSTTAHQIHKHMDNKLKIKPRSFHVAAAPAPPPVKQRCAFCAHEHRTTSCSELLNKSVQHRWNAVRERRLCFNCLGKHSVAECASPIRCKHCQRTHHSLLHHDSEDWRKHASSTVAAATVAPQANPSNGSPPVGPPVTILTNISPHESTVLLSTITFDILDASGYPRSVRALLDSGSQANFISDRCRQLLNLPRRKVSIPLNGLGQMHTTANRGIVACTIKSKHSMHAFNFDAIVMPTICGNLPPAAVDISAYPHLQHLLFADPMFTIPAPVDLLIGAELVPQILLGGRRVGPIGTPTALETIFGWTVIGKIESIKPLASVNTFFTLSQPSLESAITKFWMLEQCLNVHTLSPEEKQCELSFKQTHRRDTSGRYEVALPFSNQEPVFTNSYEIACRRFLMLENRLQKDANLRIEYVRFMTDYIDTGHMQEVAGALRLESGYYIPHHGVFNSKNTLRVVFDASAVDATNNSLNSTLLVGPKLQSDIFKVLVRFRCHAIALTADIRQMYRQILIQPAHRDFQRILWRDSPSKPLVEYELCTVAYGVASSPFLAQRVLQQLARDEQSKFPLAASILRSDTYVDDILTGATVVEEAQLLQRQLVRLLGYAQMELRKWASNSPALLETLPPDHCQMSRPLDNECNEVVKVLGMEWNTSDDGFTFTVVCNQNCALNGIYYLTWPAFSILWVC